MSNTEQIVDSQIATAEQALETLRATLETIGRAVPNPSIDAFAWGHLGAVDEVDYALEKLKNAGREISQARSYKPQE